MLPLVTPHPWRAGLVGLFLSTGVILGQHVNLNFSGNAAWTTSETIPASPTTFTFPDGVTRTPADFYFNNGASSTWHLDNGAVILSTQTSSGTFNRFFVGVNDGKSAQLTLTTQTPNTPGKLVARYNATSAVRIGSQGTLIIDGGVTLQSGYIFGEGASPAINIPHGRLDVFSGSANHRLKGITVTLGQRGVLWIEDSNATITSIATFNSFTGATLLSEPGSCMFINSISATTPMGSAVGTLVIPTEGWVIDLTLDSDGDGLPDYWELMYGLDPYDDGSINVRNGPDGDPDNDGLTNSEEFFLGSNPVVNESGKPWQPRPKKAALLVVSTHPDDEGIFFGGTFAYYTQVRKVPTISVSMTSGDAGTRPPATREEEFRNAVWAYGLRTQPLFPRFKDIGSVSLETTWATWGGGNAVEGRKKATRYVAGVIRKYRPEVIATHSVEGEYGHTNHIATALAVIDAYSLAADSTVDIDGLPAWRAKKLYVHEWQQNKLFHDYWETPFEELDGKTAREVTNIGLDFHASQGKPDMSTIYLSGEVTGTWDAHPSEYWGLHSTTVGYDTIVPDFSINTYNASSGAFAYSTNFSGWACGDFFQNLNLDLDENGLPDDWEALYYPNLAYVDPSSDTDGDGFTALDEYIHGTSPVAQNGNPVVLDLRNGVVGFQTIKAEGIGYEGKRRSYRLESSVDLKNWDIAWQGYADGNWKSLLLPTDAPRQFYRLAVTL
ncbi:MAG: PIG-L family deacetylase, partial [Puniceicoccales bacterium]|nr:PIG-L family deacetylase [Puniceicoccales bacterium]